MNAVECVMEELNRRITPFELDTFDTADRAYWLYAPPHTYCGATRTSLALVTFQEELAVTSFATNKSRLKRIFFDYSDPYVLNKLTTLLRRIGHIHLNRYRQATAVMRRW
jgi:hypothetical protein